MGPNTFTAANIVVNHTLVNNPQQIAASSGVTQAATTTQGIAPSSGITGTAQVETLTIGSGATEAGTLGVAVTAAGMNGGSPITINVPVTAGETADNIASGISSALNNVNDYSSLSDYNTLTSFF